MSNPGADSGNLLVRARAVLLDAVDALAGQKSSIVMIGAQAVYLNPGSLNIALAEATNDADLALDPPESLRTWLVKFNGSRLVVPRAAAGWVWVGSAQADLNQAALALRQLAEGQEVRQKTFVSGSMIFLYVIAGLFGLEVLGLLVSLGASLLFR